MSMKTLFLTEIDKDISFRVKANESLEIAGVLKSGWTHKRTLRILCDGEHARANIVLATQGCASDSFPLEIITEQRGDRSSVTIAMRSVLRDTSNIFCNGMMSIAKGVKGSRASFAHHALLLSSTSRAKIIPSLEIHSDDVIAGHAVTVGRPEEEHLLYLRSRGIDAQSATRLLAYGFALRDAGNIRDPQMRSDFIKAIDEYAQAHA